MLKSKSEVFAVRLIPLATSSVLIIGLISACAQSEFAGDTGQGVRNGIKPPGGDPNDSETPPGNNTPGNDDSLKTDDGGKIELVDADLIIERHGDGAHYQNCMTANIQGQAPLDIGCNRPAPHPASYGRANPFTSVKVKLMTNTCNVLQLAMKSKKSAGGVFVQNIRTSGRVFTSATKPSNGPGYVIDQIPNGFRIYANDNPDNNWGDLSLSITAPGTSKIKFTIEGSNIPCPQ